MCFSRNFVMARFESFAFTVGLALAGFLSVAVPFA
jgi:hypothetical protein